VGPLPPCSASRGQGDVRLGLHSILGFRPLLRFLAAVVGTAILAAPGGLTLAAEGVAGDKGDELRASRRLLTTA